MHVSGFVQPRMLILRLYIDYIATGATEAHGKAAQHSTWYTHQTHQRLSRESDFKLNFDTKRREAWTILQAEKKNITLWRMEDREFWCLPACLCGVSVESTTGEPQRQGTWLRGTAGTSQTRKKLKLCTKLKRRTSHCGKLL